MLPMALVIVVLLVLILVQIVIWRIFGRIVSLIRHPGSLVEMVGVAVHLPWCRCPYRSSVVVRLAWPMISCSKNRHLSGGRVQSERVPRPCPKQALTCNALVQTNRSLLPELRTPWPAGA